MKELLEKLRDRVELTSDETQALFSGLMSGTVPPAAAGAALALLAAKGPTPIELGAAATVMRRHALTFDTPLHGDDLLDTCGTGGDGRGTFNISTAAALVAAGAGVRVVKHGNRSATSKSGSADVLEALGVRLDVPPARLPEVLAHAGVCFCFARAHHPAMKNVAEIRAALGIPTVFNLLGPLTNPAGARRQLLGVYKPELLYLLAETLLRLGSHHAWVVHGTDGLDELSTLASTSVAEVKGGRVTRHVVDSRDFGLPRPNVADLIAESPAHSAQIIRRVLAGEKGPARDIIALNAAAALIVSGKAESLDAALRLALHAIDSGAAQAALDKLTAATQS